MTFLENKLIKKQIGDKRFGVYPTILTSESPDLIGNSYLTQSENFILVKDITDGIIILNNLVTQHIVIKCLGKIIVKPFNNKIDDEFDEIELGKGSCVEFLMVEDSWYIISSDGLKQS
jgi:hypothetical protein